MSILSSISKIGLIPSVVGGNIATSVLEKITGKKYGRTTTEEASKTTFGKILGLATAGTATGLLIASGGATAGAKVIATQAITKPIQTATAGLIGIPLIVGAVTTGSPEENIAKISQSAYKAGAGIVETIQEHPTASAVIGSVAGGFGIYQVVKNIVEKLPAASFYQAKDKAKDKAKGIIGDKDILPPAEPTISGTETPLMPLPSATSPVLPETAQAEGSRPQTRRKKRLKAQGQKISQRVDVRVGVSAGNKKYIRMAQYH